MEAVLSRYHTVSHFPGPPPWQKDFFPSLGVLPKGRSQVSALFRSCPCRSESLCLWSYSYPGTHCLKCLSLGRGSGPAPSPHCGPCQPLLQGKLKPCDCITPGCAVLLPSPPPAITLTAILHSLSESANDTTRMLHSMLRCAYLYFLFSKLKSPPCLVFWINSRVGMLIGNGAYETMVSALKILVTLKSHLSAWEGRCKSVSLVPLVFLSGHQGTCAALLLHTCGIRDLLCLYDFPRSLISPIPVLFFVDCSCDF